MKIKLITLNLPEPMITGLDSLVDAKYFPHRAEAIRVAIRNLLAEHDIWNLAALGQGQKSISTSKKRQR